MENIKLPEKPRAMSDGLWAVYVAAHKAAIAKMQAKGSSDSNYYYKLIRRKLGSSVYELCLKYFMYGDSDDEELLSVLKKREQILETTRN